MKRLLVALLLCCGEAHAFDSRCRAAEPDCSGEEAARTAWVVSEHGQLWLEARQLAGLPAAVDEPFTVSTPVASPSSLAPAPFQLTTDMVDRTIELAVFAQLPDLSYTLWDWASGNEGCPPSGTDGFSECHAFKAHMGWLNSTHFLPQSEKVFRYLHSLAIERAGDCAAMKVVLTGVAEGDTVLQACDREALLIEAQAHHYLQDAWSMGHMWERWGSPEIADFAAAAQTTQGLPSVKALGDAVGRASGIIHGAKAITGFDDSMCGPQPGVAFTHDGQNYNGAGDLFTAAIRTNGTLRRQHDLMMGCLVSAMREVYDASAQSLGTLVSPAVQVVEMSTCFSQRATNRAIGLGAAIQVPTPLLQNLPTPLAELMLDTHDEYTRSLGVDPSEPSTLFLPLTSELITRTEVNLLVLLKEHDLLFAVAVLNRWHDDMLRIQRTLSFESSRHQLATNLATGGLGPLLGLLPNANYPGVPVYADPPLPWTPKPLVVPAEPRVENAGNIMARTFVDAHAQDWCEVLHENGDDEFSLSGLRDRCIDLTEQGDPAADVACGVCARFARWHLWPSTDGEHRAEDAPVCEQLAGPASGTIRAQSPQELMDSHFSGGNAIVLAGGSLDGLWCGFGEPMVAFLPPDVPEPLCTGSEQTTPVDIAVGRLTVAGDSLQSLLAPQVIVTSSGRVYDTVVDGVRVRGVNVGPGTTRLHLSLPEFGIERDFSVTVPERSCLDVCGRFFDEFGDGICFTTAGLNADPDCCCCL